VSSAPPDTLAAQAPPAPIEPTNVQPADQASIARAVELLRAGEVVAFPTETVYGLGADAASPEAVAKLFALKGRPETHPVIVHLAGAAQLEMWAREIPAGARRLASAFWPGPLTLILKRAASVLDAVTGGQDTVGLRVPSHPAARALLEAFGDGIAGPSANKFGRVSPTTALHVFADFGLDVPIILDGGACPVGIESTIVDLSGERPRCLRPGGAPLAGIEEALGEAVGMPDAQAPRAPGSHASHYAPRAQVKLVRRVEMLETLASHKGRRVGVLALEVSVPRLGASLQRVVPCVAAQYARDLYAHLRSLDAQGVDVILVEAPPKTPAWGAINDRLARAGRHAAEGETT
jgi:L-threonylcarbamoyladenylate synthase